MKKLCTLACLCLLAPVAIAQTKDNPVTRQFEVTVTFDIKIEHKDEKERLKGDARYRYSYERLRDEATLQLSEMATKIDSNDGTFLEALMNRNRFPSVAGGKTVDLEGDAIPKRQREVLDGLFGKPMCKVSFDEHGKELRRTHTSDFLVRHKMDRSTIANARCFHAPFYPDRPKWESLTEISGDKNTMYAGTLTYEKVADKGRNRNSRVKVSGALDAEKAKTELGELSGRCQVSGEQVFDNELREWVAGEWNISLTMRLDDNGKKSDFGTGKMQMKMKMLEKK